MKLLILLLFPIFCFSQEVTNFEYFSIGYDSTGTQWCSYRLTKEMVQNQKSMRRKSFTKFNGFTTSDYTNTGLDRSHLAPANFFSFDEVAYTETFTMGNVVPMYPSINRQIWKYIENYEEKLTEAYGCIFTTIKIIYGNSKVKDLILPIKFIKTINNCNGQVITVFEIENI